MELAWLEDFLALASSLNFSRAAEARHITQPAFSRRIKALEAWLGADLFVRSRHGVALTPAGVRCRDQADTLVRAIQQLRREALDAAGHGSSLTIAATHALSFTFFPQWIRNTPEVLSLGNLSLISDTLQACEHMLVRGDAQFLLCHHHSSMSTHLDSRSFKNIKVGSDTLLPLSAPGKAGKPRWRLHPKVSVKYLAYSADSGIGRIISSRWTSSERPFALDQIFTSHLAATLQSMARAGDGVAWLPRTLSEDDLATGRLVPAGNPNTAIPIDIRLFRPAARQNPNCEAAWMAFRRDTPGAGKSESITRPTPRL